MESQQTQDPMNALLSEFSTRLTEIEEKQRLLKDRILLIGQNLLTTKENYEKQTSDFRNQIKQLDQDVKVMKQFIKRITETLDEFARKSDFQILARQAKMFQPLELARIQDVREIVREELKNHKKE